MRSVIMERLTACGGIIEICKGQKVLGAACTHLDEVFLRSQVLEIMLTDFLQTSLRAEVGAGFVGGVHRERSAATIEARAGSRGRRRRYRHVCPSSKRNGIGPGPRRVGREVC